MWCGTFAFRLLLPPSVAPEAPKVRLRELGAPLRTHLRDPGLLCLFGVAFLLMGAFVTVYNYLGFRLIAAPFGLPGWLTGLVFLGYLVGTWASTAAGRLGDRVGRRRHHRRGHRRARHRQRAARHRPCLD